MENTVRDDIKQRLNEAIVENFYTKFINLISEMEILDHLKGCDSLLILVGFFILVEEICEIGIYLKSFGRMIIQVRNTKIIL